MSRAEVFLPATIGNVGPGFDVLGLAVGGLGDTLLFEATSGTWEISDVQGRDANAVPRDPSKNAASIAAKAMLSALGLPGGGAISIHRQLPMSGGLGGSAAASVGGALAAALAHGTTPTHEELFRAALEGERAVAGAHLDNIAPCVKGGLTLVRPTDPPDVTSVPVAHDYAVALVTPNQKLETKASRAVLPSESARSEWILQMANTAALCVAFATGDHELLRRSLSDVFAEPRRAPLIEGFFEMKRAALEAGALGCSISGAGPTVFALCADKNDAHRAATAMADALGHPASLVHVGAIDRLGARRVPGIL